MSLRKAAHAASHWPNKRHAVSPQFWKVLHPVKAFACRVGFQNSRAHRSGIVSHYLVRTAFRSHEVAEVSWKRRQSAKCRDNRQESLVVTRYIRPQFPALRSGLLPVGSQSGIRRCNSNSKGKKARTHVGTCGKRGNQPERLSSERKDHRGTPQGRRPHSGS